METDARKDDARGSRRTLGRNTVNQLFRERLIANIDLCLVEAENCVRVAHPGMIGNIRQIVVEWLLSPLLPDGIHIGTGKITDSNGNLSAETDVIIYDRRSVPPLMYDEKNGVFPIESVYYAMEVKSTLTAEEFESTIAKGERLRTLVGRQPHSVLFAFASNLKDSKDSQRFIQRQKDIRVPLPVSIFCVAGREYGYWDHVWKLFTPENKHDEIVAFVVGVMNTLVKSANRPSSLDPGWYYIKGA